MCGDGDGMSCSIDGWMVNDDGVVIGLESCGGDDIVDFSLGRDTVNVVFSVRRAVYRWFNLPFEMYYLPMEEGLPAPMQSR